LDILEKTGLNPDKLVLEMTEEILTESYDMVKEKLISLKQKGIKIAMDDFGKNYSTLDVLSRLPINTLKIDKVFIENFLQDKPKQLITDLIISIGKKMGFEVLAEGVETREQYEYLKKYENIKAQGFYISKPVPIEHAEKIVRKYGPNIINWKLSCDYR
jgi:EAL domain-containing protein (putative c-di-GMP-specific phosphodiesterase class I)